MRVQVRGAGFEVGRRYFRLVIRLGASADGNRCGCKEKRKLTELALETLYLI